MIFGYARVSTMNQDLDTQLEALGKEKCSVIFQEKISGTTRERPEFKKMLNQVSEGDTIVVTKLDRFARNTREALDIIEPLLKINVTIRVLDLGTIENTIMGRMMVRTILSVGEMERDMIVERTQEGRAFARKNNPNYREGRPKKYTPKQLDHAMELKKLKSYKEVSEITGISVRTLQREHQRRKAEGVVRE